VADLPLPGLLDADGTWRKLPAGDGVGVHRRLQQLALERGARRPPDALVPVTAP
jgi:hypothetical protein